MPDLSTNDFRSDYMSLKQAKNIQAICIILVIFHHMSLKLCDPNAVPAEYIRHGLEPFMYIGYLLVAVFFFYSGYGLYISLQQKENYLGDFFFKRLTPILIVHVLVNFLFMVISNSQDISISFQSPFTLFGPNTNNPYSWYIYTIIICYFLYYMGFKYIKKENWAIALIIAGLTAYIIFCNYWLYGGWWYNTVLIFPFGIIYAKNESAFQSRMTKYYRQFLVVTSALAIIGFFGAEILSGVLIKSEYLFAYSLGQLGLALLRTFDSGFFVLVIVLCLMKVKIENRILTRIGELTLEIYLVHGIYVQIFASEYLAGYNTSVHYISNQFIYMSAVLVLTGVTAYLMNLINQLLFKWIQKELRGVYKKTLLITAVILAVLLVLLTVKTYRENASVSAERAEEFAAFAAEQDYVTTSAGRMAYYMQGEGDHTIVVLGSINDPSSELVLRYVAKFVSKENKVCIFDFPGSGFSDDAKTPRTADNLAKELHEALSILNPDEKYILMPCDYTGTCALRYIELYPDEVEGLIGMDMMLPSQYDMMVSSSGISKSAYEEATQKAGRQQDLRRRFMVKYGYSRWLFTVYEALWMSPSLKDYIEMTEEVYIKNQQRDTAIEFQRLFGQSSAQVSMDQLPEDLPVIMIVDYVASRAKIGKTEFISSYYDFISNEDIQEVHIIQGDQMFIYYQGVAYSQMINEFLHTNWPK